MFIKQLSIFIENRSGRLEEVTETLKVNQINIVSLSLADTSEYGMLRLVVSDPVAAKAALADNGFSAMLTDVLAVKLPHKIGMLQVLLKAISDETINIEYMYALATGYENASMIIKVSNPEKAIEAIKRAGLDLFSP